MFYSLLLQTLTSAFNWERVCIKMTRSWAQGGEKERCAPPEIAFRRTAKAKPVYKRTFSGLFYIQIFRNINFMGHAIFSFQTKQKSIHFSDSKSKVRRQSFKVFQIVSPKMCHVTQRHVGFRMLLFFFQNKIDALKENLCTTRWLLNGLLSHWNVQFALLIEQLLLGRDAELIFIAI